MVFLSGVLGVGLFRLYWSDAQFAVAMALLPLGLTLARARMRACASRGCGHWGGGGGAARRRRRSRRTRGTRPSSSLRVPPQQRSHAATRPPTLPPPVARAQVGGLIIALVEEAVPSCVGGCNNHISFFGLRV